MFTLTYIIPDLISDLLSLRHLCICPRFKQTHSDDCVLTGEQAEVSVTVDLFSVCKSESVVVVLNIVRG